jgi:hypothetical protein
MSSETRRSGRKRKAGSSGGLVETAALLTAAASVCALCQAEHPVYDGNTADGTLQRAIQALGSQFVCAGAIPLFFPDTLVEMQLTTGPEQAGSLGEWNKGDMKQFRARYKKLGKQNGSECLGSMHVYAENWKGYKSAPGGQINWWIVGKCPYPNVRRQDGSYDPGRPSHSCNEQLAFSQFLLRDERLLWMYNNCSSWAKHDGDGLVHMPQWLNFLDEARATFPIFAHYCDEDASPSRA